MKLVYENNYIDENGNEVRVCMYGGLVCPNPLEYYKNTRSYEQLKEEYNLLNCGTITEEDILEAKLRTKLLGFF